MENNLRIQLEWFLSINYFILSFFHWKVIDNKYSSAYQIASPKKSLQFGGLPLQYDDFHFLDTYENVLL